MTWVDSWEGYAAVLAVLGGFAVFARAGWHVVRILVRVDNALPTLLEIADEFRPNNGTSLHDQITAVRHALDTHISDEENTLKRIEARLDSKA